MSQDIKVTIKFRETTNINLVLYILYCLEQTIIQVTTQPTNPTEPNQEKKKCRIRSKFENIVTYLSNKRKNIIQGVQHWIKHKREWSTQNMCNNHHPH